MADSVPGGKLCIHCGEDCTGKPRVKDAHGHYACKACFEAARAKAAEAEAKPAKTIAKPAARPAKPAAVNAAPAAVDDDAAMMAALLESPGGGGGGAAASPRHCPSCGGPMPAEAAVCMHCGFNEATGKGMKTKVKRESGAGAAAAKVGYALLFANPLMWAVGGFIGGGLGAGLWALISWKTHYEIGWIAWIVGAMTGVGVRVFARGYAGALSGGIAVIIAILSIGVGKYASVALEVDEIASGAASKAVSFSDDELKAMLADDRAVELMDANHTLKWPPGKDYDSAEHFMDYPSDIRDEINKKWREATPQWKAEYRSDRQAEVKEFIALNAEAAKQYGFESSFSLFDILWAIFAIGSAWSVGSGVGGSDDD